MNDVETRAAAQMGLNSGVAGLASLVAGSGSTEQLLTAAAVLTLKAVPGADGVGVTMIEPGRPNVVAASDLLVREVDEIQYRLAEGPCVSATMRGRTTIARSLGEDRH